MDYTEAASNIISRLRQMRQLWQDASDNYFLPDRFQLSLQNCITTSRTVTFIVQSNKRNILDFDAWYQTHRDKWSEDAIMQWAVEARNTIEKRGDLTTHSQVQASIVASYLGGPSTAWLSQALFQSPEQILFTIPKKYLVPEVVNNGTLVIERRWVDSELPEVEILSALSHVYAQFVTLIADLFRKLQVPVPDDLREFRPEAMAPLAMDRAQYLSIKDGSSLGFRIFQKSLSTPAKRALNRYKKVGVNWSSLDKVTTFRELCDVYFHNARALMKKDGFHNSFVFFAKGISIINLVSFQFPNRAAKFLYMREFAGLAKKIGADGVFIIGEAWVATKEDLPKSAYAGDASARREAIVMNAASSDGNDYYCCAIVERKRMNRKKVKRILETQCEEPNIQFITSPFHEAWGTLDISEIKNRISEFESETGIIL